MLLEMQLHNSCHPAFKTEVKWLGEGFSDFLDRIPREHLLNYLYMFSEAFDVDEAFDNIMCCDFVLLVDDFDAGVKQIAEELSLPLEPMHIRKTGVQTLPGRAELERLHDMLEPEYALCDRVREARWVV
jgi:hypothetical protein